MAKRSSIVEAYLTHKRTPLITEIRTDGERKRIRKVARHQRELWEVEEQELKARYGDRWKGVIGIEAAAQKAAQTLTCRVVETGRIR
jgi:hypothetical protein